MSDQNTQERTMPEETSSPLEGKPQRRSRRSVASLLLLLGGVIIIGVVVIGSMAGPLTTRCIYRYERCGDEYVIQKRS